MRREEVVTKNLASAVLVAWAMATVAIVPAWSQPRAPSPGGLDALPPSRVFAELAARDLPDLLERAFDEADVPEAERRPYRVTVAMNRLSDADVPLSPPQRADLLRRLTNDLADLAPLTEDPSLLMTQASLLVREGVQPDVQRLEYWGPDPTVQARLRPVAETTLRLMTEAHRRASSEAEAVGERIAGPNDVANLDAYERLERLATVADYSAAVMRYAVALAMDASDPRRRQIAAESRDALVAYDSDDNPQRDFVAVTLAKLGIVDASPDALVAARERLNGMIGEATPEPGVAFDARLHRVVLELVAGKIDAATARGEEFSDWVGRTLPGDAAAEAVVRVLRYRTLAASGAAATSAAERERLGSEATAVLLTLVRDRPDLQGVIFEQLRTRVPPDAPVAELDPLLLRALLADAETRLVGGAGPDPARLRRGIEAADELLSRGVHGEGAGAVDPSLVTAAAYLRPFLLERDGRDVEASAAYVDFAEQYPDDPRSATALNNARVLVARLRPGVLAGSSTPEAVQAYDRFLAVATGEPFGRTELAFDYAERLRAAGRTAEAAEAYGRVPEGDPRESTARYLRLVLLHAAITDPSVESDGVTMSAFGELVERVRADGRREALSSDPATAGRAHARFVAVTLLAADVALRESNDPARALSLLEGVEQAIERSGIADDALARATRIRVQAFVDLNRTDEATATLRGVLDRLPADEGLAVVARLLEDLAEQYRVSEAEGDREAMREAAADRAALTPFLVTWSQNHPDPGRRRLAYRYAVLDAETQRQAAGLSAPGPQRQRLLEAAASRLEALDTPEGFARYRESLGDRDASVGLGYDPAVVLAIARVRRDLGDHANASPRWTRLLQDRVAGPPVLRSTDATGAVTETENELYWEIVLNFARANLASGRGVRAMHDFLAAQEATWGERAGGTRWRNEWVQLRAELAAHPEVGTR